ncbi:hypothetical protein B296_00014930 [Ensete ventricosum]|uniref:rRNA-processing protein EFG1 n=1 Tax=Ensete ventricosum TaxID=4639 RepID=A0A426Z778_ENSVE|nr:hypothetical protein B296_00014930 [Ensete ventricosum]
MAHGGYARRRLEERRPLGRRSKGLGLDKKRKKSKSVSLKNQIRSTERLLRKDLPDEVRRAQEQKLNELKKQQELQTRLALEHKIRLRDRKIKFFGMLISLHDFLLADCDNFVMHPSLDVLHLFHAQIFCPVDLAETASDDDALDVSEDDFFLSGSSSDEAEADDEWTDKSTRYILCNME